MTSDEDNQPMGVPYISLGSVLWVLGSFVAVAIGAVLWVFA